MAHKLYDRACTVLISILHREDSHIKSAVLSSKSRSDYEVWIQLCKILEHNPHLEISLHQGESLLREGIKRFSDEVGRLWVTLANFYTRAGLFEKARDVFEEALSKVSTARDFNIVFSSFQKYEAQVVALKIKEEEEGKLEEESTLDDQIEKHISELVDDVFEIEQEQRKEEQMSDAALAVSRMESLIERRGFLQSNSMLRQNPNNVFSWLARIELSHNDEFMMLKSFAEAVTTIDPLKAYGRVSDIWIKFAQYHEFRNDLKSANDVLMRGTQIIYRGVDEAASIWAAWVEMHLRHHNYDTAYKIIQRACTAKKKTGMNVSVSHRLWTLYADLAESLKKGFGSVKAIYNHILGMKIVTPKLVINFANLMEENGDIEGMFKVYERGIAIFDWPHVFDLWIIYLIKFVKEKANSRLERARDLFEQVVSQSPPTNKRLFYYMYADLEENYGFKSHSIEILNRCLKEVPDSEKSEVINVILAKVTKLCGIIKAREIYKKAFEVLSRKETVELGIRFAKVERKLGEIDRARAIYANLSQYCNPENKDDKFWKIWEQFEFYHGNEETMKDYMRAKRTVALKYSL